jgi:hypothetical protein
MPTDWQEHPGCRHLGPPGARLFTWLYARVWRPASFPLSRAVTAGRLGRHSPCAHHISPPAIANQSPRAREAVLTPLCCASRSSGSSPGYSPWPAVCSTSSRRPRACGRCRNCAQRSPGGHGSGPHPVTAASRDHATSSAIAIRQAPGPLADWASGGHLPFVASCYVLGRNNVTGIFSFPFFPARERRIRPTNLASIWVHVI